MSRERTSKLERCVFKKCELKRYVQRKNKWIKSNMCLERISVCIRNVNKNGVQLQKKVCVCVLCFEFD